MGYIRQTMGNLSLFTNCAYFVESRKFCESGDQVMLVIAFAHSSGVGTW